MLQTIRIFFVLALAAATLAAQADPPARAGRLNHAEGAVSLSTAQAPDEWSAALMNRPLTSGDRLWADRGSRAEFHVGPTAVRIALETSLDILNLDDDNLQMRLAQGTAIVRVRELDPGDIVEIATPSGAVIIRRAGLYRVSVDPRTYSTRVLVSFGQAEIVTPSQAFNIPSGQAAVVPLNGAIAFEVASFGAGDEFDRWSAERDRRHERVASVRHVSPHMTGYEDLDHHGTWHTAPEYGSVWIPARVASGWAPYRYGRWIWVSPWGWTWVDDAPWGFAPFHYGRWVTVNDRWAWAPGPLVRRPVYAPALVAFVGGAGWSVSVTSGPAVGWFPLGWREPFIPAFRASPAYVRNVNITHVTNVTTIQHTHVRYANRDNPRAVTVVPHDTFVSARALSPSRLEVPRAELARAEIIRERPPAPPVRASFAPERPGERPPAAAVTREVMAVSAPPAPRLAPDAPERAARGTRAEDDAPRVRILQHERAQARRAEMAGQREREREATPAAAVRETPAAPRTPAAAQPAPVPGPAQAAGPQPQAPLAQPHGGSEGPRSAAREVPRTEPAAPTPVERERLRREGAGRADIPAERQDGARERNRDFGDRASPPPQARREAPRPAVTEPAPQPQIQRDAPRPPAPAAPAQSEAPRPPVVAPVPQPQVQREAARPPVSEPAPQSQPQREPPRQPAPAPHVQREAVAPGPQAHREPPRPAPAQPAPQPQVREAPRAPAPVAQAQAQAQAPRESPKPAQAREAPRTSDAATQGQERERPARRGERSGN